MIASFALLYLITVAFRIQGFTDTWQTNVFYLETESSLMQGTVVPMTSSDLLFWPSTN
jgi:hypothetical protein